MSRDVSLVDLIVHEMRTPLTVALGSIRHADGASPAEAEAALARARRSCERLERLAAEMRDFVRVAALPDASLAPVPLAPTLEAAVARVRAERDIAVTTVFTPVEESALGLKPQLESAMTAILMALARAASPSEGLVISVDEVRLKPNPTDSHEGVLKVVARRETATVDDAADTFDAEWLGGLGFGLPLARAVIVRGGGTISSALAPDGRLGLIIVTLVAASTAHPA